MTLSNPEDIHNNSPDISAVRKGMTYPIDLSAPNAIPPQSLGDSPVCNKHETEYT